jgi:transposase-like protein
MTTATMALTELAEKGADVDVLRQMVQFMAQRLMELDVEARCGAGYDEKNPERLNSRNVGAPMDEAENDVLAFMTFPRAHWAQIYSTNPLERLNAEIKRRTNVVGIFPQRRVDHATRRRHDGRAERRVVAQPTLHAA